MNIFEQLADAMFPNVKTTIDEIESRYPKRPEGKDVAVRFAPSPTGYVHIGGLYTSLINQFFAKSRNGVFFLRIEDTDQNRKLENGVSEIVNTLKDFDVEFDEGQTAENDYVGNYGPYKQSERREIYQTFAKHLVASGLAYPCFCTVEQLDALREKQVQSGSSIIGYNGQFGPCRFLAPEVALEKVKSGTPFVVRFKSPVVDSQRVVLGDMVRGKLEMDDNNIDVVIIKSDGLPTYHFAHVIDDHLMRTSHVIRADEWISSLPLHVQMFKTLGFDVPKYAHVCPILKLDGTSKRKLSKRKDPEARVGYYNEQGYPVVAVKEYLLNLINSSFEEWREKNPTKSYKEFPMKIADLSNSGALFDAVKLNNISKKIIKSLTNEQVFDLLSEWAKKYSQELFDIIQKDEEKFKSSIAIWHANRMDVAKWSEVLGAYDFLYDANFASKIKDCDLSALRSANDALCVLQDYAQVFDIHDDSSVWFGKVKEIAEKYGYCVNMKEYKANPDNYKGSIVDVSNFVRLAMTGKTDSPDLYKISQYIGEGEVKDRLEKVIGILK